MTGFLATIKGWWHGFSLKDKILAAITLAALAIFSIFFVLAVLGEIGLLIVKSGSMQPYMAPGSLLIFKSATIPDIKRGEVVVFRESISSDLLITHRAVDKIFERGGFYIKTKGDTNHRADVMLVGEDQIMGKAAYVVPGAGRMLGFAKTPVGLLALNLMLAFFTLLMLIDRIRARERAHYKTEVALAALASSSAKNEG